MNLKGVKNVFLSVLIAAVVFVPITAEKTPTVDDLLAPYQAVLNKVNGELGSKIYIPAKNKQKVYNNIKSMTPSEFESLMRAEYLDSLKNQTQKPSVPGTVTYLTDPSTVAPAKGTADDVLNKPFTEDSPDASSAGAAKAPIPKNDSKVSSAKGLPKNIWTPLPNATGKITVTPLH